MAVTITREIDSFPKGPAPSPPPPTARDDGTARPPAISDAAAAEFMGTKLNAPIPLAYGRHLVAGAPILQELNETTKKTTLFLALGIGEWDSVEVLWVNGVDVTNTLPYHFHPGTDGETGTEDAPAGLSSATEYGDAASSENGPFGASYEWTNPNNAKVEDGSFSTVTLPVPPGDTPSNYLVLRDFGFAIPGDATINGFKVDVKRKKNSGDSSIYARVQLVGVTGVVSKADIYGVPWPDTNAFKSYGSSTDRWGISDATPAVVNDAGFGVALYAQCTGEPGAGAVGAVDVMRITVYYTVAGGTSRNQKLCTLFPANYTPLTFSRTAYLSMLLDPDPAAPTAGFDVRGIFRTKMVRIFDADGVETSYAFSQNPAWQILDLLIDYWIKPRALVNAALSSDEKAKINFPSYVAAADYADALITVNGESVKRFESNVVFVNQTNLNDALTTILAQCRGFLLYEDGKFKLVIDAPRSSVFTFIGAGSSTNIVEGTLSINRKSTRELTNRLVLKSRDPGSGEGDHTKDFKPWQKNLDDETQQDFAGRVISQDVDFGAQTPERSERLGRYIQRRTLDLDIQAALAAILDSGKLSPGDRVLGPSDHGFAATLDYEVIEIGDHPDGTREFQLQKYDETIFDDTAEAQQAIEETNIPTVFPPRGTDGQVITADSTAPSGVSWTTIAGGTNAQTGTSYTVQASDQGKLITFLNASPVAVTLASTLAATFFCAVANLGAGPVTLTPSSGNIDGLASLVLGQYEGCWLFFDGTNWRTERGLGIGGVNAQTGTSYTVAASDRGKLITQSNASASAYTLPATLGARFMCAIQNLGAGTCTLTPSSGTINGAANLALATGSGAILFFDGTNWEAVTGGGGGPYDVASFYPGAPTASVFIARVTIPRAVVFPSSLTGSSGTAGTAATASTVFSIKKNGTELGTATFAAAGTTATFASTSGATFAAGDVLTIVAPASPDATLADISITLAGTR